MKTLPFQFSAAIGDTFIYKHTKTAIYKVWAFTEIALALKLEFVEI
jgi:hypothetical protein